MSLLRRLKTLWWLSGQTYIDGPTVPALKKKKAVIIEPNEALKDFTV